MFWRLLGYLLLLMSAVLAISATIHWVFVQPELTSAQALWRYGKAYGVAVACCLLGAGIQAVADWCERRNGNSRRV